MGQKELGGGAGVGVVSGVGWGGGTPPSLLTCLHWVTGSRKGGLGRDREGEKEGRVWRRMKLFLLLLPFGFGTVWGRGGGEGQREGWGWETGLS